MSTQNVKKCYKMLKMLKKYAKMLKKYAKILKNVEMLKNVGLNIKKF